MNHAEHLRGIVSQLTSNTSNTSSIKGYSESIVQETEGANELPVVQIDAQYDTLFESDVETFVLFGSADAADGQFRVNSGTTALGFGIIRSLRSAKFRPGQFMVGRFCASFTVPGVALTRQVVGFLETYAGCWFGYDGTQFGTMLRQAGKDPIVTFTITSAPTSGGTVTFTLNGVNYDVVVTSGTIRHFGYEVEAVGQAGFGFFWEPEQVGDDIVFQGLRAEDWSGGSYAFADGGTGVTGTFTIEEGGAVPNDIWTYQSNWSEDPMDGTGPSGMTLDQSKLNIYYIEYQDMGVGSIKYYIQDDSTCEKMLVHRDCFVNVSNTINQVNPTMGIGLSARSFGAHASAVEMKAPVLYAAIKGKKEPLRNTRAVTNEKTSVGSTLTNILSIRNANSFKANINQRDVLPLGVSLATDGTKSVIFNIVFNPTLGGETDWDWVHDSDEAAQLDTAATTVTDGELLDAVVLAKEDSRTIDLSPLQLNLGRRDVLTIAAQTTSGSSDITVSLVYQED